MKKALSFAVALGLVAGVASVASAAELTINGDARWRGVYKDNTRTADDNVYDRVQGMDQRYRFNADLKINDDVKVNTRLVLWDNEFGNENKDEAPSGDQVIDRANMVIKTLGGTWTLGRQDASWGNKFMAWGASVDRIKAIYKAGDITFGGYLQKNLEDSAAQGNGDGDKDTWGALVIGKAGDTTWGVLANYNTSDTNAAKADGKDSGYLIDPYFTSKIGAATLMGELVYTGGDLNENANGDAVWGGFVAASVDLAPATVKGLVAYWDGNDGGTGNRDCDNDFAPSLLIGSCNETAVIDFGSTTSGADDFTYLVGAGVDFKANDKLTVGGLVGYLMATDKDGYCATAGCEESASLVEIDLTAKYALAQNATYNFGISYAMPDQFSAQDDDWLVIGNRVDVNW